MKPRTKLQSQVYALSVELPKLAEQLKGWAFENCVSHLAYRTKKATACLSCGHTWKGHPTTKEEVCPSCSRKVSIEDTRKKLYDQMVYFAVLDTSHGFQVNRYFQLKTYHKGGTSPIIYCREVAQQWMQIDGKHEVVARNRGGMGYYQTDNFHGDMEIRDRNHLKSKYNIWPFKIHPDCKVLPIYKRNGFRGKHGPCTPYEIFTNILSDSKGETLLKAKQLNLLGARIATSYLINRYWDSIKICIRNKYIVKDASIWLDYLDLLEYFRKDLRSPKYVCPSNLKQVHDKLVAKKANIQKREDLERKKLRVELDQISYTRAKSQFFGLFFTDGDLSIKVLESIQEFIEEGDTHKHCVFTNSYYNKPDSLIFSAKVNGKPVETIELSLEKMKILQSRGLGNEASEYHDHIIKLLQRNLNVIAERRQVKESVAA